MRISNGVILLTMALLTGCETIKTRTDHDDSVDFSTYRSFSWIADDPLLATPPGITPLAGERIRRAVLATLESRGYAFTTDRGAADFLVGFTVGARDRIRVDTTTYPVGFYGPHIWGRAYYQDIDVRDYTEGRLAIDVFDAADKRPVWHGFATKSLTGRDQGDPERLVNAAVAAILKAFPPGAPR